MIKRAETDDELLNTWEGSQILTDKTNAEALKIYALWLCYGTKYDFCRFYTADGAIVCGQNGSFVLSEFGNCDFEELAGFFAMGGFAEIFCSERAGTALSQRLRCLREDVYLMRFDGTGDAHDVEMVAATEKETPLEEFYKILKTSFDIEFEPWYLDMSHRIRHGITRTRRLDGSVLVIQHDLCGSALLSQVATLPEKRGRGGASALISAVCAELNESEVFVICEDKLRGFYERNGFSEVCKKCILRSE